MGRSRKAAWFFFIFYLLLLCAVAFGKNMLTMYMMAIGMILDSGIELLTTYKK